MADVSPADVLGPLLSGVLLNTLAYGVCLIQFFEYYTAGFKDRPLIRFLVGYELCLDTAASIIGAHMIWQMCITNFNNPDILSISPWSLTIVPILHAFTAFPIQLFLGWRIKMFEKDRGWIVFTAIAVASSASFALAITTGVRAFRIESTEEFAGLVKVVVGWLALSVAVDLSLAGFLIYYLARNKSGMTGTNRIIHQIIQTSGECAGLVTLFCIMQLIMGTVYGQRNYHFIFAIPGGRMYTNTLLRNLNVRSMMRDKTESDLNIWSVNVDPTTQQASSRRRTHNQAAVRVDVTQEISMDVYNTAPALENGSANMSMVKRTETSSEDESFNKRRIDWEESI